MVLELSLPQKTKATPWKVNPQPPGCSIRSAALCGFTTIRRNPVLSVVNSFFPCFQALTLARPMRSLHPDARKQRPVVLGRLSPARPGLPRMLKEDTCPPLPDIGLMAHHRPGPLAAFSPPRSRRESVPSRFTSHASRITHHASRITDLFVLRSAFDEGGTLSNRN